MLGSGTAGLRKMQAWQEVWKRGARLGNQAASSYGPDSTASQLCDRGQVTWLMTEKSTFLFCGELRPSDSALGPNEESAVDERYHFRTVKATQQAG